MSVRLALYTTYYPAALPYLAPFAAGLAAQHDADFELWVGLDGVARSELEAQLEGCGAAPVRWLESEPGETPTALRGRALAAIVAEAEAVVLVDGDDVAGPERVAAARAALAAGADVYGCALDLVDESGAPLGLRFAPPPGVAAEGLLPRMNAFGFSNTAYRSSLLAACLPVPDDAAPLDWLVASRARLLGARFAFDRDAHMHYRQHGDNVARVRPPFSAEGLLRAARLTVGHYRRLLAAPPTASPSALAPFQRAARRAERFLARLERDPLAADAYLRELNARPQPLYLWWECIANEELMPQWNA